MSGNSAGENIHAYPYFTFNIPPSFRELPLASAAEERTEQLYELVDEASGGGSSESREAVVGLLADLIDQLMERDVVHVSFGTPMIEDHPSAASLTASVRPFDYDDARAAVDAIAANPSRQGSRGS